MAGVIDLTPDEEKDVYQFATDKQRRWYFWHIGMVRTGTVSVLSAVLDFLTVNLNDELAFTEAFLWLTEYVFYYPALVWKAYLNVVYAVEKASAEFTMWDPHSTRVERARARDRIVEMYNASLNVWGEPWGFPEGALEEVTG